MSYQHILLSPEDYSQFGAISPSPFTINQIPKPVTDYNNSTFLRLVYPTKYKAVNQTKLSPEEKLYRVIKVWITFQNNTSFAFFLKQIRFFPIGRNIFKYVRICQNFYPLSPSSKS